MQREVLKWIQGMDLTFAVKNPQRDICNGFLIAEIISRYHPNEVYMHAFDRGISSVNKQSNWLLLEKLFNKLDINVATDVIDRVINCRYGAAEIFLASLYAHFNEKTVTVAIPNRTNSDPRFAQPTASTKLKDPDIDKIVDKDLKQLRAWQALDAHENSPPHETDRLVPRGKSLSGGAPRVETARQLGKNEVVAPVEVKQVQVKTLVASQLRQHQRDLSSRGSIETNSENQASSLDLPSGQQAGKSVLSLIRQVTHSCTLKVRPNIAPLFAENEGVTFVQQYLRGSKQQKNAVDLELCMGILSELENRSESFAQILKSPSEFWRFFQHLVLPLTDKETGFKWSGEGPVMNVDPLLVPMMTLFSKIVSKIAYSEPLTAQSYVREIFLASVATKAALLNPSTGPVFACSTLAPFIDTSSASTGSYEATTIMEILRTLRKACGDDLSAFVHLLPSCIRILRGKGLQEAVGAELNIGDFLPINEEITGLKRPSAVSPMDPSMLDGFLFYASEGLKIPSASVHADSWRIVALLSVEIGEDWLDVVLRENLLDKEDATNATSVDATDLDTTIHDEERIHELVPAFPLLVAMVTNFGSEHAGHLLVTLLRSSEKLSEEIDKKLLIDGLCVSGRKDIFTPLVTAVLLRGGFEFFAQVKSHLDKAIALQEIIQEIVLSASSRIPVAALGVLVRSPFEACGVACMCLMLEEAEFPLPLSLLGVALRTLMRLSVPGLHDEYGITFEQARHLLLAVIDSNSSKESFEPMLVDELFEASKEVIARGLEVDRDLLLPVIRQDLKNAAIATQTVAEKLKALEAFNGSTIQKVLS